MRFLVLLLTIVYYSIAPVFAEPFNLEVSSDVQSKINKIGFRILNSNRIEQRVTFKYLTRPRTYRVSTDIRYMYFKRIAYITQNELPNIASDEELAAVLSRRIAQAVDAYDGIFRGYGSMLDYWVSPQKYNNLADKRAVDYMVNAGYNPLALIVVLSKSEPQRRYECLDSYSLASRRMANIYEYVYNKYPSFLANNYYSDNDYYQNFLLTSRSNRAKLQKKIETNSKKKIHYN